MSLAVASLCGPYEILSPLSAGGMGEVYLARDTRLQRDVALKVLPAAIANDPDRRRRFVDEARATGALNHPNIVAIYDVSFDGDVPFLVTEFVEGTTLRSQMEHGAFPVTRSLEIAAQIASGLSAAHDIGIVHRDLKPENVMMTRDGRAKILDFGLAKSFGAGLGAPAITKEHTETGIVLGTVPYMSPEQAKGATVDYRSDQFALGVLLYEMLSGKHPFRRRSSVQTLSAIIDDDPTPLDEVKSSVPAPLQWLVERCLAKDPAQRYAATPDLARDLSTLLGRLSDVRNDLLTRAPRSRAMRAALITGVLAVAVVGGLLQWRIMQLASSPLGNYVFTPLVIDAGYQGAPAWSPDGRSLSYVAQVDGIVQVFTKGLSASSGNPLTHGLWDCRYPFWAPDGRRIYFLRQAQDKQGLFSISVAGGEPQPILPNASRAAISPDGRSLAFFTEESEQGGAFTIWAASAEGNNPRKVSHGPLESRGLNDGWLGFSPDSSQLLVWISGWLRGSSQPRADYSFWIIPWPNGQPRPVLQSLANRSRSGGVTFDWFPDNRHVVISLETEATGRHLVIGDTVSNQVESVTATTSNESYPRVSPDGSRVAFTSEAVDFDLIQIPLDGGPPSAFLQTARNEFDPAWSPDETQYAFATDRSGWLELWLHARGAAFERVLFSDHDVTGDVTFTLGSPSFSADGSRVAFQRQGERSGYRIWIVPVAGAGPPMQLVPITFGHMSQDAPTWSPGGDWIAYVQGMPGGRWRLAKAPVGTNGAEESVVLTDRIQPLTRPDWSPDGRLILFDSMDGLALISPAGGEPRVINYDTWLAHTWSWDSRTIYGLRETDTGRRFMLVALDVTTGRERVLNPDLGVIPPANQPIRGLTRIGRKALGTSVARARSDIYQLQGFKVPTGAWARLRSLLHW